MRNNTAAAIYIILMIAVIVAVDLLFFKGRPSQRLAANVAIVLIFAAIYFRFVKRS